MAILSPDGEPPFQHITMGVGTWAWGDRLFWGFGRDYDDQNLAEAYDACLSTGIPFFDTAEVYAQGYSEKILGKLTRTTSKPVFIATKFMPFPWRLSRSGLLRALKNSLKRLGLPRVDLYQIHMPLPPLTIETWMAAMVEAVHLDLTRFVGVSNYDPTQMKRASDFLSREGLSLASNQVEYSLLHREPEKNGLLSLCHDLGIALIAYSPLKMGLLSGKYSPENPPSGMRSRRFDTDYLRKIQPLISQLRRIGAAHDDKTPAQVALNWTICKGTIPIPGAKNAQQVQQNAGALGWQLSPEEIASLDELSDRVASAA